jgi:hypothetical protein
MIRRLQNKKTPSSSESAISYSKAHPHPRENIKYWHIWQII